MKKTLLTLIGGVLLGVVIVPGARADEASKRAKVEQLFAVTRANQITEQVADEVRKEMQGMAQSMPGAAQRTAEQKRLMNDFQTQVLSLVNQTVGWKAIEPQLRNLYASTYTEEEIDGMLAFYKSPVGQSMLAKGPGLTQKSMELTRARMMTLQPRVQELTREFTQKYAAAQPAPPTSGVQPKK